MSIIKIKSEIDRLQEISKEIRLTVVDMLYKIGPEHKGHAGPALSITDIITCLYFNILNIDPKNPGWEDRDRFVLSKGHACPSLYAALAIRGFFDRKHLYTFRHVDSILQGHPDMKKTPGIDMTSGSLGHGIGAGLGMALAAKMDNRKYRTYVLVGDGEMQEGLIWESIMFAGHKKLDKLSIIIDRNNWQSCGAVDYMLDIEPLASKLTSFNWSVVEIDGHNIEEILAALNVKNNSKPLAVIAKTVKGKGISFMENDNSWHQRAITKEEYCKAMAELKESDNYV